MESRIPEIEQRKRQAKSRAMTDNLEWFVENQDRLVFLYEDMYIVIRNRSVIATFNTGEEARKWMLSKFYDGKCSYYHCVSGTRAYSIDL